MIQVPLSHFSDATMNPRLTLKTLPKTCQRESAKAMSGSAVPAPMLPGAVCEQWKRCGKSNCRCASGNKEDLHGPYYYRFWREEGRLRKAYVPGEQLEEVRAACARYREERQSRRRVLISFRSDAQSYDDLLRQVEQLCKSGKTRL